MVPVEGFKVEIVLKNKTALKGFVSQVVEKVLTLENAELPDGSQMGIYTVAGSQIEDLKVIEIPKDLQKKQKKKNKDNKDKSRGTNSSGSAYDTSSQLTSSQSSGLQDDSIVFYRSSTPSNDQQNRQKKKLLKRNNNTSYNNDQDVTWDENISQIKSQDFDFGGSTRDFDKHAALREFVSNDTIDPSQRLAGHNKLKSPVKTKYDHDENVLGNKMDNWDSDSSITVATSSVETRSRVNEKTANKLTDLFKETSIKPRYNRSPSLEFRGINLISSSSGDVLPLASPIQLLEIERLASESFKITPQLLAENASRGISGLVLKILGGSSRISNKNHNLPPLVLIFAGNNRAGARALAAGRQLTNHGVRVIAFTLTDFNSTDDFDDHVRQQLELYQLAGGKCTSSLSGLKSIIADIDSPIELVIDALQGSDTNLSDLWGDELESAKQLIRWVSQQDITTLSIDIPSGIDSGSGLIGDVECINAKWVVSLGLPVNGIIHAYSNGAVEIGDWTHYLIDIGLPSNLFKKGSFRKFDRNWFSGEWSVSLEISDK